MKSILANRFDYLAVEDTGDYDSDIERDIKQSEFDAWCEMNAEEEERELEYNNYLRDKNRVEEDPYTRKSFKGYEGLVSWYKMKGKPVRFTQEDYIKSQSNARFNTRYGFVRGTRNQGKTVDPAVIASLRSRSALFIGNTLVEWICATFGQSLMEVVNRLDYTISKTSNKPYIRFIDDIPIEDYKEANGYYEFTDLLEHDRTIERARVATKVVLWHHVLTFSNCYKLTSLLMDYYKHIHYRNSRDRYLKVQGHWVSATKAASRREIINLVKLYFHMYSAHIDFHGLDSQLYTIPSADSLDERIDFLQRCIYMTKDGARIPDMLDVFMGRTVTETNEPIGTQLNGNNGSYTNTDDHKLIFCNMVEDRSICTAYIERLFWETITMTDVVRYLTALSKKHEIPKFRFLRNNVEDIITIDMTLSSVMMVEMVHDGYNFVYEIDRPIISNSIYMVKCSSQTATEFHGISIPANLSFTSAHMVGQPSTIDNQLAFICSSSDYEMSFMNVDNLDNDITSVTEFIGDDPVCNIGSSNSTGNSTRLFGPEYSSDNAGDGPDMCVACEGFGVVRMIQCEDPMCMKSIHYHKKERKPKANQNPAERRIAKKTADTKPFDLYKDFSICSINGCSNPSHEHISSNTRAASLKVNTSILKRFTHVTGEVAFIHALLEDRIDTLTRLRLDSDTHDIISDEELAVTSDIYSQPLVLEGETKSEGKGKGPEQDPDYEEGDGFAAIGDRRGKGRDIKILKVNTNPIQPVLGKEQNSTTGSNKGSTSSKGKTPSKKTKMF